MTRTEWCTLPIFDLMEQESCKYQSLPEGKEFPPLSNLPRMICIPKKTSQYLIHRLQVQFSIIWENWEEVLSRAFTAKMLS